MSGKAGKRKISELIDELYNGMHENPNPEKELIIKNCEYPLEEMHLFLSRVHYPDEPFLQLHFKYTDRQEYKSKLQSFEDGIREHAYRIGKTHNVYKKSRHALMSYSKYSYGKDENFISIEIYGHGLEELTNLKEPIEIINKLL